MTERPHHVVNDGVTVTDPALPEVTGVDLALSADRIESLHGTAAGARYRHFLAQGLAQQPDADRNGVLTLAALAAWRSGALGFRADALRRLDLALAGGGPALPGLAAALGLEEGGVEPFAQLQRMSRFGWPGLHTPGQLLAVLGGFRGLFGPWLAPPVAVSAGDRPGTFLIRTVPGRSADAAAEDWQLTVDVFGHTLVRVMVEPDDRDGAAGAEADPRWLAAGDAMQGLAEAGAAGAVLRVHGYTARLRLPEETP